MYQTLLPEEIMKFREYSYFSDRRVEDEDDDYCKPPSEEEIAEKIRWFHEQYAEVKDRFRGWFEELGYTVTVQEVPITMREGYPGDYASVEYRFMLKGNGQAGERDREVRLRPFGIWMVGNESTLDMGACEKICYFRKDGPLTIYGGDSGYEKIDEDGWYWDDQYPGRTPGHSKGACAKTHRPSHRGKDLCERQKRGRNKNHHRP
jgi:hypothetical protein